ncbi:MAB_1171c family putative transporter [Streptomyces sp. NPDC059982]|uniref:MAB_1171c family putative transporter n=1 Tax=Streptomyces sp. NPDC059982 TaxID=3347024 RepID=UPI0036AFCDD3
MNGGLLRFLPGSLMVLALLVKVPSLRREWDRPLNRTACLLLVLGAPITFLASPPTISAVNRATGVVNFSAPLVFSLATLFSGTCVVLVLRWRGGPAAAVRRATRLTAAVFGGAAVAIVVLFVIGDAPVERLRDLDTYYATTPWIREMIVCFLLAHTVGALALTALCAQWWRRADRSLRPLRTGLALIVLSGLLDLAYLAAKWAAFAAHWAGRDWVVLSTDVAPPLASGASLTLGAGFLVPLAGGSSAWRDLRHHHGLRPLWKALRAFASRSVTTVPLAWWSPLGIRLVHRESVIDDGLLALAGWFDPAVREAAYAAARRRGLDEGAASVVADAAVLAAACRSREAADRAGTAQPPPPPWPAGEGAGQLPERPPLRALARALRTSPIVAAAARGEPPG